MIDPADFLNILEQDEKVTVLEVQVRTGDEGTLLAYKVSDLMDPTNTVEENLAAGREDVQFLRELADRLERELTAEKIQATMDHFFGTED